MHSLIKHRYFGRKLKFFQFKQQSPMSYWRGLWVSDLTQYYLFALAVSWFEFVTQGVNTETNERTEIGRGTKGVKERTRWMKINYSCTAQQHTTSRTKNRRQEEKGWQFDGNAEEMMRKSFEILSKLPSITYLYDSHIFATISSRPHYAQI